jgi:uncharacterized protein (TIGR03086 family)
MGRTPDDARIRIREDQAVSEGTPVRETTRLIVSGRDREAARQGAQEGAGPMDPLQQLDQLAAPLGGVVAGISADQLGLPTPCGDFDVRGVLEHMIAGAATFAAAFRGEAPAEPDLSDPLAGFAPALGGLVEAISGPGALERTLETPFGEVSGETFARYVVLDGLVHGWDLAMATRQPYHPSDELVAEAEAFAQGFLDPLRDGAAFGAAAPVGDDATPIERLAAYTGRTV